MVFFTNMCFIKQSKQCWIYGSICEKILFQVCLFKAWPKENITPCRRHEFMNYPHNSKNWNDKSNWIHWIELNSPTSNRISNFPTLKSLIKNFTRVLRNSSSSPWSVEGLREPKLQLFSHWMQSVVLCSTSSVHISFTSDCRSLRDFSMLKKKEKSQNFSSLF